MAKNRYPIYVLSKGRYEKCLTALFLMEDKIEFSLVVEEHERDEYASRYGEKRIIVLPSESSGKGAIPVRNWIWEHSISNGDERHWILDDNIWAMRRFYKGYRIKCDSSVAFCTTEDFTDRYENIAISGLNYTVFAVGHYSPMPPFYVNTRVYSCLLIRNDTPVRWRGKYNADTDICLQVLSKGLCTVLINVFLAEKAQTMSRKGGNTEIYQGDGRLKMARSLERLWPGVVTTTRRFGRPQHRVNWRKFDTPLKRRTDIDFSKFAGANEYGLKLTQIADKVKSAELRKLLQQSKRKKRKASKRA